MAWNFISHLERIWVQLIRSKYLSSRRILDIELSKWSILGLANIHNRHKTFLWHIISNVLPTRDRLSRIPEIEDKSCPICHNEDKTISNLFLNAPLLNPPFEFTRQNEDPQLWSNKIVFNESISTWEQLMQSIQFMVKSYWDVVICRNSKAKVVQEKQWACRPKGCLKLNFDASLDDQNNVLRDLASDAYVAEAAAALLTLKVTEKKKFSHVICEGDTLKIVNALNGHSLEEEWQERYLIEAGKRILARWPKWKVTHVGRVANTHAHNLAA
ncbi:hypothetical protein M9H77_22138 [Catharanthus roseus]|uniref:Uncharacterized protein n=1 Tax=Catharanthus roseus TaxID=4058 RepID=A0ACC0APM9_CATRO|nr:hypothetical protein M9H77_22138 [Catharanthus roseus]